MLHMFSNGTIIRCLPSEVVMDAQSKRKYFDTLINREPIVDCVPFEVIMNDQKHALGPLSQST